MVVFRNRSGMTEHSGHEIRNSGQASSRLSLLVKAVSLCGTAALTVAFVRPVSMPACSLPPPKTFDDTFFSASLFSTAPVPSCRLFLSPPYFLLSCSSFSWALLRANSCALQLRGFCFHGSSQTARVPSQNAATRFGSSGLSLLGAPRKWDKKGDLKCLTSTQ